MFPYFAFLVFLFPSLALAEDHASVQLLARGRHALARIHDGIQHSRSSIDAVYYIFEPCHSSGRIVVEALTQSVRRAQAQGRNQRVRLLIDGFSMPRQTQPVLVEALRRRGIEVRIFNRSFNFFLNYNNRNHAKFIVFDNQSVITGGRNIGDDYFALHDEMNFLDKDVFVVGRAAQEATAVFETYWNNRVSTRPRKRATDEDVQSFERECLQLRPREREILRQIPDQVADLDRSFPARTCPSAKFIADPLQFTTGQRDGFGDLPAEDLQRKSSTRELLDFFLSARTTLRSENFSFIPPYRIYDAFQSLSRKGVNIDIVVNALTEDDDHVSFASQFHGRRSENSHLSVHYLLPNSDHSVEDWILDPNPDRPWFLHSKTYTVDGQSAVVSSFNIDPRSYHTNLESALIVKNCPAFTADVDGHITLHIEAAIEADERGDESTESERTLWQWLGMLLKHDLI